MFNIDTENVNIDTKNINICHNKPNCKLDSKFRKIQLISLKTKMQCNNNILLNFISITNDIVAPWIYQNNDKHYIYTLIGSGKWGLVIWSVLE